MTSGNLVRLRHRAASLRDNRLGDPTVRDVLVITPPGYERSGRGYPVVFWLAGFGSRGADLLHGGVLGEGLDERLTAAMRAGAVPEALVVLPDCSTRYGGSQYLDSAACGRYQTYLVDELVPLVDARFRTLGPGRRAVGGKSSGGYGALLAAMCRPGVFDTVCAHSPDAGFEWCYLSLLPAVLDTLRARGGWAAFTDGPRSTLPRDGAFMVAMSLVAVAACYSDRDAAGGDAADGDAADRDAADLAAEFPCDPETGSFREKVWRRWLRYDPVRLVAVHADRLRALRTLYLDVGRADEYAMHWGTRALHAALADAGVPHHYVEHDGGHHGIDHRFVRSLALAGRRWARAAEQTAEERACVASPAS
ncbi:MAG: alpha/beta hydrolase [Mycobacteriales bacterium]